MDNFGNLPSPCFSNSTLLKANMWSSVLGEQHGQNDGEPRFKKARIYSSSWKSHSNVKDNPIHTENGRGEPREPGGAQPTYFCDTCDRGFLSEAKYRQHISEHETCRDPSCSFIAAPKLVQLHYRTQHDTGLINKIKEADGDIEKWRAERRKNYPTAANVERKQKELQERIERGVVLETRDFGQMRGRGRGRGRDRGAGRGNGRGRGGRGRGGRGRGWGSGRRGQYQNYDYTLPTPQVAENSKNDDPLSYHSGVDRVNSNWNPINSLRQNPSRGEMSIPTSRKSEPLLARSVVESSSQVQTTSHSVLSSLMSCYDSSDEEGEVKDEASTAVSTAPTNTEPQDHSRTTFKSEPSRGAGQARQNRRGRHQPSLTKSHQGRLHQNQRNYRKTKSTLLEKLLASEIRHERNTLLQCVRFVTKNNFLDASGSTKEKNLDYNSENEEW